MYLWPWGNSFSQWCVYTSANLLFPSLHFCHCSANIIHAPNQSVRPWRPLTPSVLHKVDRVDSGKSDTVTANLFCNERPQENALQGASTIDCELCFSRCSQFMSQCGAGALGGWYPAMTWLLWKDIMNRCRFSREFSLPWGLPSAIYPAVPRGVAVIRHSPPSSLDKAGSPWSKPSLNSWYKA